MKAAVIESVGRAARRGDADRGPAFAEIVVAVAALPALVAVEGWVYGDLVTDRDLGDLGADRDDLAGELVARHDRQLGRELALHDV